MRHRTQAFTSTEVKDLMLQAKNRSNMPDLWKSFCRHAINEENAHAVRDQLAPTVEPMVFSTGDDSDDSDYDSEQEDIEEARIDVSNKFCPLLF